MLAIDIGNTRIKWGLFSGGSLVKSGVFDYQAENVLDALKNQSLPVSEYERLAISCVANDSVVEEVSAYLSRSPGISIEVVKTQQKQCGVINAYDEYEQLGVDRWLALIAAYDYLKASKHDRLCVIDCGTAITFDVLESGGRHIGGFIMPGLTLMKRALLNATDKIAGAADVGSYGAQPARNTVNAVATGCELMALGGIDTMISEQVYGSENCGVLFTGGDGAWLSGQLEVESVFDENLVLKGLYRVLQEKS